MKLIVGLGNPGKQYQNNRHNIGFQCVDLLAQRHGLRFAISKGKAKVAMGDVRVLDSDQPAQRVLLAKPQTFMNNAGQSVAALARFYKAPLADLLVVFDDLDLPLGKLRLRPAGGSGGHNGLRSIIRELGGDEFPRLRIGIDRPPGHMDPADYVLQDFSPAQEAIMLDVRQQAVAVCEQWLFHSMASVMNAFN